jgi:hypothetical protein
MAVYEGEVTSEEPLKPYVFVGYRSESQHMFRHQLLSLKAQSLQAKSC